MKIWSNGKAKNGMPYEVRITVKDNDMNVIIRPQPVAVEDKYVEVVAGRFQRVLMDESIRNTHKGRAKLKAELEEVLEDFHNQKLIRPVEKEKDEGIG
jgi:hypothetical protein